MAVDLIADENKRTLDVELWRLGNCLVIIQDSGYLEEAKDGAINFAEMHISFIEKNKHKYPEQRRKVFKKEFKRLKELFNTLLSFFVSTNKKS